MKDAGVGDGRRIDNALGDRADDVAAGDQRARAFEHGGDDERAEHGQRLGADGRADIVGDVVGADIERHVTAEHGGGDDQSAVLLARDIKRGKNGGGGDEQDAKARPREPARHMSRPPPRAGRSCPDPCRAFLFRRCRVCLSWGLFPVPCNSSMTVSTIAGEQELHRFTQDAPEIVRCVSRRAAAGAKERIRSRNSGSATCSAATWRGNHCRSRCPFSGQSSRLFDNLERVDIDHAFYRAAFVARFLIAVGTDRLFGDRAAYAGFLVRLLRGGVGGGKRIMRPALRDHPAASAAAGQQKDFERPVASCAKAARRIARAAAAPSAREC
jgi:hypothetical protein